MRISVFGSTGPTGLLFVELALAEGHQVVTFARTPSKLLRHPRLSVVEGTLDDASGISGAIARSEAVISLLGPGTNASDAPPLTIGCRNIVVAMHQHGVRRLVTVGTPSMSDDADDRDRKLGLMVKPIKRLKHLSAE